MSTLTNFVVAGYRRLLRRLKMRSLDAVLGGFDVIASELFEIGEEARAEVQRNDAVIASLQARNNAALAQSARAGRVALRLRELTQ